MTTVEPTIVYQRSKALTDLNTHYCPGCTHGVAHRLVAEVLEEMNLVELKNKNIKELVGIARQLSIDGASSMRSASDSEWMAALLEQYAPAKGVVKTPTMLPTFTTTAFRWAARAGSSRVTRPPMRWVSAGER